jgi:hypothetical protein
MLGLAAAILIAAPAARAQQAPPADAPPAGEALPDRIIEGIRDLFRAIFGEGATRTPQPGQPEAQPGSQPGSQTPPQARPSAPAATEAQSQPVSASPSAAAAPLSLHSAIAKGDYASALKMIEQGTDIEAKDPGAGASPLHYAVMKGEMPLVGLLVQRGADVNRTKSGTSPLHTAVLYGRFEVAEYLLEKGSNVNAKSASGATPLSLAQAAKFERIAIMLKSRGAN